MVKCLATFSWYEPDGQSLVNTKNILFEYGELDLDEYFVMNHPPFLLPEIQSFWGTLLPVLEAIETIHNLKSRDGPNFHGYTKSPSQGTLLIPD